MTTMASSRSAVVTLPSDTQIMITRTFAAPARLVWQAWTTPDLIARWWHANRGSVTQADVDLRPGGRWRWVMVTPSGFECAFSGEYRDVRPHALLVFTEVFEGMPDAPALTSVTLAEADGRTVVTVLVTHSCREHRDAHLESGMEPGMQDALDLLEQVAMSLH